MGKQCYCCPTNLTSLDVYCPMVADLQRISIQYREDRITTFSLRTSNFPNNSVWQAERDGKTVRVDWSPEWPVEIAMEEDGQELKFARSRPDDETIEAAYFPDARNFSGNCETAS